MIFSKVARIKRLPYFLFFFDWKKSVEFHKQRHTNTAITVATEPRFRTILS